MKKTLALILGGLMVLVFAAAASAEVSIGGNVYFRLDGSSSGISDASKVDYFQIDVSIKKDFGDTGNGYLTVRTQTWARQDSTAPNPKSAADPKIWRVQNYGYTYKFSDALSAGILYDAGGVTLSDGVLATSWDWKHIGAFTNNHILKVTGTPIEGVTGGLYFDPVKSEYIIKGEYKTEGLKVGGGYSNAKALTDNNLSYNIYAEVAPVEGAKVYVDYAADGKYLLDASWAMDPITLAILYSNEDKFQYDYKVFTANTADISATYALSEDTSVKGGLVYDTDPNTSGLDKVYFQYSFGKAYVRVSQNLSPSETTLSGGYNLDGSNTLTGSFNLKTNAWSVVLALGLW